MNKRPITLPALYALFALSGFCGLIYESIWSHYLKLFVGHAAHAQTLVLAAFMGGMGLGAWLTAKLTGRIRNLLWAYALVEATVGAAALIFHGAFATVTEWAYSSLLPATCAHDGTCWSQWAMAVAMILPQSILLGATFPLMSGGILRIAPQTPGRKLALLYFLNSIGAVFGVLASGFLLIPLAGLPGALLTAGLGNVALAVAVYFLGKPDPQSAQALPAPAAAQPLSAAPRVRALLVVSLLTGLSSFIYEVVWIRMLSMVLGSATHSFELMLASFILGLALGGWWIRKRIDRVADVLTYLAVVQLVMGVCALMTLPMYNHTFDAMAWLMSGLERNDTGYVLYTLALKVVALCVMLPATFCAGMTLPLITYSLFRAGSGERAIGQVYAANTLGAIAGVILAVYVLMPNIGLKLAMVVAAAIDVGLGIFLLRDRLMERAQVGLRVRGLAVGALLATMLAPALFHFDPLRMGSSVFRLGRSSLAAETSILFAKDGRTATVQVALGPRGEATLSTNGKADGSVQMRADAPPSSDELTMVLLGALPLAYRPLASDVAVIGFGTGMSSATLLGSPHLKRLETIEIEPAMLEAARVYRSVNEATYTDARHRVVIEDAKAYFARGRRMYDVIVSEPSNPWVSGVSSLFTDEFYARARQHLRADGLLVQWLQLYEITPELASSVFRALGRSFPAYDVYVGAQGDAIIVASPNGRLPSRSPAMFEMPAVRAMLARVGIDSDSRLQLQFATNDRVLAPLMASYGSPANSDFFPIVDLYGPKARFQRADARIITALHLAEMPILRALDGVERLAFAGAASASTLPGMERQWPYLRARQLAAFVRHGHLPPAEGDLIGDYDAAIVLRNRLFTCQGDSMARAPWEGVVRFAAETIPNLSREESTELWQAVRDSPCAKALDVPQQRWLHVLGNVAAARWRDAGPLAQGLLADLDPGRHYLRAVLTQIAVVALLMQGEAAEAGRTLDAQVAKLPPAARLEGWARMLRASTAGVWAGKPAPR